MFEFESEIESSLLIVNFQKYSKSPCFSQQIRVIFYKIWTRVKSSLCFSSSSFLEFAPENASSEFERVWRFSSTTVDESGSSSSRDSVTTLLLLILQQVPSVSIIILLNGQSIALKWSCRYVLWKLENISFPKFFNSVIFWVKSTLLSHEINFARLSHNLVPLPAKFL